jgi:PAS domain S-box-containing protein
MPVGTARLRLMGMVLARNLMHALGDSGPRLSAIASTPAELQLGTLFERVLDAIIVARMTTGQIVLWNRAAEKLFGYSAAEAIGQSIEILMPRPIADVHRAGMSRYLRTGHGLIMDADSSVEMPARKRSGDEIRVELTLSELRDQSGERYAVAAVRDATMRKELELTTLELVQARVARSQAEAELVSRDELLATICSALESDPSPYELELVVRALTQFRQLHSGELRLHSVELDLVDILHAATDDARRHTSRRRLLVHAPPLAAVRGDPDRMRQVLDQVLDEATRRTRDGARIEITLELVSPHLVQLSLRADACGDTRPVGPGLQLSQTLIQRQGGTFTTAISSGGSLEVVLTLPGSPHLPRRRASRPRRPRSRPSS